MTSQLNNTNENQDQMLQEETLRPVFFDLPSNRGSVSVGSSSEKTKRARLDASVITPDDASARDAEVPSCNETPVGLHDPIPPSLTPLDINHHRHHAQLHHRHILLQHHILSGTSSFSKSPKLFRRFRSRSLPIINYTSRTHVLASLTSAAPSLPPINLQSLKEIDLHEILKNPQLRHDILFDPQLQFRPNLDGDRGRRKKSVIERYWAEIEKECKQFFDASVASGSQPAKIHRLPALFTTLRDILMSLLPGKDRAPVNEIMDMDLAVQQFSHGSFDFVAMAHWLGEVFKSHCAPMRDQWVSDMISKFQEASNENSVVKLVQGLRSIFSILEAMKLDVANHQIRILRPVLIETAVDFERDYFNQLISHCKIDIKDSLKWFAQNCLKILGAEKDITVGDHKSVLTSSIIDLLSCRNMATEFPSTLAFDHTRLILLRADVRQLVCVQLCVVLFKQLISSYESASSYRAFSLQVENVTRVQEEILAIVTDEHGNVKWTRNIRAIAIQLVRNVVNDPSSASVQSTKLPQPLIDFSYNWLIKQIQPSSDVYGLMEAKVFKDLIHEVGQSMKFEPTATQSNLGIKIATGKLSLKHKKSDSEMTGIANRISTLMKFHWDVFGDFYLEYIKDHKQS
ncbi:Tcp11-domain-containing protein [Metschnikowia bicuspidata var. bicuspidata NRRL YB-4993]|uniref:Tcp11-domain-containing protein n=1 Tax=Metschnikowia bicuspidata var. bicuspidata NRRL YB-4993 TaxID=869754 RepID=A0A1A0HC04_9ASCO|nr:Tcp11-domain-containing protein [Metschnikowia bicuspidata var. bicuspidata NRRL YB-4993]OBA21669.1 Tcp11-domain-containing protein [Metschnikowia bicuspidata var. bicuspidata NRRL YB-4993]